MRKPVISGSFSVILAVRMNLAPVKTTLAAAAPRLLLSSPFLDMIFTGTTTDATLKLTSVDGSREQTCSSGRSG